MIAPSDSRVIQGVDVFSAVLTGQATIGIVPDCNTIVGPIQQTRDQLHQHHQRIRMLSTVVLPIQHCLLAQTTDLSNLQRICSHEEALNQCQQWLRTHLAHAQQQPVGSTAEGARMASEDGRVAAVASRQSLQVHPNLRLVTAGIQDRAENETTFLTLTLTESSIK